MAKIDEMLEGSEKKDLMEKMFLHPGGDIDLFSGIPPIVVEPLVNVLWYSRFIGSDWIYAYCIQLMRVLVSVDRKGRNEFQSVYAQRLALMREIRDDARGPGDGLQ